MKQQHIYIVLIISFIVVTIYIYNTNIKEALENYDETKNPKLIFNAHWSGLFCNINRLINYLVIYPNIREIDFNVLSSKTNHKPFIGENIEIFSKLFQKYKEDIPIDTIYNYTGTEFSNFEHLTHKQAYQYYNENRYKLEPYNKAFNKYIHLLPHLQERLDKMVIDMKNGADQVIGIFVRSNALAAEQPTGVMPTREEYLEAISKLDTFSKKTKYFLRIDNEEDYEFYKSKLSPVYETNIKRAQTNKGDAPHTNGEYLTLEDLENTYLEIALLSRCDILVHCVSNMATAALYMNMNLISICVSKPAN
jgi:hypothetical protein